MKVPLQTVKLRITWTPAQATTLWFLTGKRVGNIKITACVNGIDFAISKTEVHYRYL